MPAVSSIPIFVVTGFLSSGKTTFINQQIKLRKMRSSTLIISAEDGIIKHNFDAHFIQLDNLILPEELESVAQDIKDSIHGKSVREIWLEWNGMISFQQLERLIYQTTLSKLVHIQQVYFVTTCDFVDTMLGATGLSPISQLMNADTIILRHDSNGNIGNPNAREKASVGLLKTWSPPGKIIINKDALPLCTVTNRQHSNWLILLIITLIVIYACTISMYKEILPNSVNQLLSIYIGIIMQAIPFLVLGTLGSTVIRYCIPTEIIERTLYGPTITSMGFALLGGLLFPMCDCASIPTFRSLLIRKVKLPIAITFMLASPILNPIVLISTWYAFGDHIEFFWSRFVLGAIVAILSGLSFINYNKSILPAITKFVPTMSSYSNDISYLPSTSKYERFRLFTLHAQNEFFQIGTYFLIGSFITSFFQVYVHPMLIEYSISLPTAVMTVIMMILAFLLSLCSTSDAIIGRTLANSVPLPSILGFLIFGPMMDIKNVWILQSLFPKAFVTRLLITTALLSLIMSIVYDWLFQS